MRVDAQHRSQSRSFGIGMPPLVEFFIKFLCTIIDIDLPAYRRSIDNRAVRKSVSMPAWMAYQSDQRGINYSKVLQEALKQVLAPF